MTEDGGKVRLFNDNKLGMYEFHDDQLRDGSFHTKLSDPFVLNGFMKMVLRIETPWSAHMVVVRS